MRQVKIWQVIQNIQQSQKSQKTRMKILKLNIQTKRKYNNILKEENITGKKRKKGESESNIRTNKITRYIKNVKKTFWFRNLEKNIRKMYKLNDRRQTQIIESFMNNNNNKFQQVVAKLKNKEEKEEISEDELVIFILKEAEAPISKIISLIIRFRLRTRSGMSGFGI